MAKELTYILTRWAMYGSEFRIQRCAYEDTALLLSMYNLRHISFVFASFPHLNWRIKQHISIRNETVSYRDVSLYELGQA